MPAQRLHICDYISGDRINRPEALRRLPLDLFRSQDYPGQPDTIGDASERFLTGNQPPIYVPDRMMYTRWTQKRDIFGANTVAMLSALKQAQDVQTDLQGFSMAQAGNVPVGQSFYDSADDITGSRLPTLNRLSQQDYERTPLARNAIPISGFVDSDAAKSALGLQGISWASPAVGNAAWLFAGFMIAASVGIAMYRGSKRK